MVGKTLGPYKIIEQLGAGGMGEVYLGEDTRLGRKVAIKVLPAEFASDAERLARFEQEARAAAALNHPHIAVVHDVGSEPGEDGATTHFMVQEYLEGQSLRERLEKGALDIGTALELADEVSQALVAAHKAGIVHRDLKPDNIFITEDGHAKVLDFGLAKLTEALAPSASSASMSPTLLGTVAGQVMGTAGYMAPEQVNGEEVDARADVFAFGAVLYETVTGRRAFVGESVVQTLSMISHEEPAPLNETVASAPTELSRIVRKCLAKPPARRYQSAADLAVDLRQLREDVAGGVATVAAAPAAGDDSPASGPALKLAAVAAVTAIVALAAGLMIGGQMSGVGGSENAGMVRSTIAVDPAAYIRRLPLGTMTFTPDGQELVFVGVDVVAGVDDDVRLRRLYRRRLDGATPTPIAGTDGAAGPQISPDGEWILFWSDGALRKVPIDGGSAETLRDLTVDAIDRAAVTWYDNRLGNGADIAYGATWDGDDAIVYARFQGPLWSISATGGDEPQQFTTLDPNDFAHRTPAALPGGGVLFTVAGDIFLEDSRIDVITPGGERKSVIADGSNPRFVAPDMLLFARQGTLMAVRFDLENFETIGEEERRLPDVAHEIGPMNPVWASGIAQFAATPGALAFLPGGKIYLCKRQDIFWFDDSEETQPITREGVYGTPRLSPGGSKILAMSAGSMQLVDPESGVPTQLAEGLFAVWEPDGEAVIHGQLGGGQMDLYRTAIDGSSSSEELLSSPHFLWASSVDPQGRFLAYVDTHPVTSNDIWILDLDGELPQRALHETKFDETHPMISPDGKWLAFVSDKSGEQRVYVQQFPGPGLAVEVSRGAGTIPSWVSTSDALVFSRPGSGTWRVDLEILDGNQVEASPPELFSPLNSAWTSPVGWTDLSPDGERALGSRCQDDIDAVIAGQELGQLELLYGWRNEVLQDSQGGDAGGR